MIRFFLKILYAVLLGLVGAAVVHIVVLLMLPVLTERDAWSRLALAEDLYAFVPLGQTEGAPPVARNDPLLEAAACRFDLADGPVHITAVGDVPFWSISVYDRRGQTIYSFNDRTAADRELDLVLATPAQTVELKKAPPPEFENSIIVEPATVQGIVLLRAFVPDPSWRKQVLDYLANAECVSRG